MKRILNNDKGQAMVEFILFLPFMLMLYMLVNSIGSAINGSINQQKITRAYYFYRAQNNSMVPKPDRGLGASGFPTDWNLWGMSWTGWMTQFGSGGSGEGSPLAPCYRFNLPLATEKPTDTCEEGYSERITQFIRVMTVFGVCGATYANQGGQAALMPGAPGAGGGGGSFLSVASTQGCIIQ